MLAIEILISCGLLGGGDFNDVPTHRGLSQNIFFKNSAPWKIEAKFVARNVHKIHISFGLLAI